jgi:hypothetical protein
VSVSVPNLKAAREPKICDEGAGAEATIRWSVHGTKI